MRVVVTVKGTDEAARDLDAIGRRAVKAAPAMRRILALLLASERVLWRTGGLRWRRLDPDTQRHKRKTGHTRPLVESGRLERSLTQAHAPDAIREAHDDYLEFGTRVDYARYHQRGQGR